jgi:hypothetical protein
MQTRIFRVVSLIVMLTLLAVIGVQTPRAVEAQVAPQANFPVYLPLIQKACSTGQSYIPGLAYRSDPDNPARPAYNHADKNLALRSYAVNSTLSTQQKQIAPLYPPSNTQTPHLRTLFNPARTPTVLNVYNVYDWNWATSPSPGTRSGSFVTTPWPIQVAGVQVTLGETIRTPSSTNDLGAGVAAIVLYADASRITIHYTRDDGVAKAYPLSAGYTVYIENICVDSSLLALYNSLETAGRYNMAQSSYNLVALTPQQPIGTALGSEMQIVVRDNGGFMDPRSQNDWWQ